MSATPLHTVNSGGIVKDSGTYRSATGRQVTLVRGKRSPPIKGGGVWTQVFDTNTEDRASQKLAEQATVITTREPSEPSPFAGPEGKL